MNCPSFIIIIFFADSQMLRSWVISKTVFFWSEFNFWNSSKISCHVTESNAHVGSSARSKDGLETKARAMHTLCCCHQESWFGRASSLFHSPTIFRASAHLSFFSLFGTHIYDRGRATCSRAGILFSKLYHWKTNQIVVLRIIDHSSAVIAFTFSHLSR